jgi:hypothetical protein
MNLMNGFSFNDYISGKGGDLWLEDLPVFGNIGDMGNQY